MKKAPVVRALSTALLVALSLPALLAAGELAVKPEFKKEVMTTFKRLQTDPQFQALKGRLKGNVLNRPVVDSYLRYLPIPPLEMFNLELKTRRIDLAVPDFIEAYNERWKELHPQAARRFYGRERGRHAEGVYSIEQLSQFAIAEKITRKKAEVGTNRNVAFDATFPPRGFQSEVQIVLNPNNPNQLVAASNTRAPEPVTCGPRTVQSIYYSSNGGATWGRTCAPAAVDYGLDCDALGGITSGSDPALVWNANGEVFLNHMMVCFNGGFLYSMVIARSLDAGATWSPRAVIKNSWATGDVEDKEFLAIDNNAGSPYSGRLYSCWNRNNDLVIASSGDNGATWTERDLPAPPQGGIDINCDIAVQKNGTVHVVMETISCGAFDCDHEWIYHTRSTDGGQTWSAPRQVAATNFVSYSSGSCPDAQDFRCLGSLGAIDVDNSNGPCGGSVYIAYSDFPAGGNVNNMDILMRRSTDLGNTWSVAVRANDDASGRVQFNPFLSIDQVKGQPVLAWVDGRNDPGNLSMDVFASRSVNCGGSFKKNVQVTQPSAEFNNGTISWSNESSANPLRNGNQFGDYMGVDARNGKAYVAWTDSRHFFPDFQTDPQRENIGFAVVTFGPAAPDQLVALADGQRATLLRWTDSPKAADLVGYNVYRVSGGVYTRIGYLAVAGAPSAVTRSFSDSARAAAYAVAGVDSLGEEGPYSNPVSLAGQ